MEPTMFNINMLPTAVGQSYSVASPLTSVESTASNASTFSSQRRKLAEWNVPAKEALLDLAEVHSQLERIENECERIMAYKGASDQANSRPLLMQAQREPGSANEDEDEDDGDFCTEITTPSRTSSCLLSGAFSLQPANPLPEANFDSHGLGFFGDVGVDYLTLSKGTPILSGARVARIEEENDGGLPWDC